MDGAHCDIELETGQGTNRDGRPVVSYRIREAAGRRRLLADFDLVGDDIAFAQYGRARTVPAKVGDLDRPERIFDLLDRLTNVTGWVTDRSQEQVLAALGAAFPNTSGLAEILAHIAAEVDGTAESPERRS